MAEHSQQTLELFAQIGARLRAAREDRGYTLQDLSSQTRINLSFLDKIEAGDLAGLPGLAFVKGFIRNYISVLEIQDPELIEELGRLGPATAREQATQLHPSNPQVLDTEPPRPSYLKMGLFALVAVLILWVGYVLFSGSDAPPPVVTQPPAPAAPFAPGEVTGSGQPGGAGSAAPTVPAASNRPPSGPVPAGTPPRTGALPGASGPGAFGSATRAGGPLEGRQKLELTIRGLERTWVRLSIDRAPSIDVLLQPAETVAWQANQEIRLTIGRSNGVAVYLNGEEILLPAEPNRLIPNLVLNKLTLLRLEN